MSNKNKSRGITSLVLASLIWGTSFPAIKLSVSTVNEITYTWARSLFAFAFLLPYVIIKRRQIDARIIRGGLSAGITYALGIWLQGWGTRYTTASNSAFITGLYMVFVHLYVAFMIRRYTSKLSISLLSSMFGLYLLSRPDMHLNIGDILVLSSSLLWAANILLIDIYSDKDPILITFFELLPSLLFFLPDLYLNGIHMLNLEQVLVLIYLGIVCSSGATIFQVYGQRFIEPATASIVYLLEPISASIFSFLILGEIMSQIQIVGALFILLSMFVASSDKNILKTT